MINSNVLKITLIPANIEENILQMKPIQICELIVYYVPRRTMRVIA